MLVRSVRIFALIVWVIALFGFWFVVLELDHNQTDDPGYVGLVELLFHLAASICPSVNFWLWRRQGEFVPRKLKWLSAALVVGYPVSLMYNGLSGSEGQPLFLLMVVVTFVASFVFLCMAGVREVQNVVQSRS